MVIVSHSDEINPNRVNVLQGLESLFNLLRTGIPIDATGGLNTAEVVDAELVGTLNDIDTTSGFNQNLCPGSIGPDSERIVVGCNLYARVIGRRIECLTRQRVPYQFANITSKGRTNKFNLIEIPKVRGIGRIS